MWPYPENALGDIYYGYDEELNAIHIKDKSGDFYCIAGGDIEPIEHLSGQYKDIMLKSGLSSKRTDLNQVYHASIFEVNSENSYMLNYAIVGTDEGRDKAISDYRYMLENPDRVYSEVVDHYNNLLASMVIIDSPDDEFNRLWKWSLIGVDRFFVETPGLGSALVAGYSTVDRGWDGGHKVSGRPGYGWYFGRDSEWSCFAINNYGNFEIVRSQLEFLQKFQDQSGKIFHELSTSGAAHYDAADATPLYIILAGHYLKSSGDIEFIKDSWGNIQKAMEFLYSTDTDGDLLIENTNVGHGWVEGGKLWGAHSTFYLSGLWAQALEEAAYMASCLGKNALEKKYKTDADKVKNILDTEFWNNSTRFYNYGKLKDGNFNPEKTILPAPIMHFGFLNDKKVSMVLQDYAGNEFSTDWGLRILSSESPLFDPSGYHEGSVWPLFTGWCALAEYRYGNSVQGFTHIMNNLYIKNHWNLGFVEEVMNGLSYEPAGVCPHQCWSETNIIQPAIEGMIGLKPDAPNKSAKISPRFPLNWDKVLVKNLRIGNSQISMEMNRSKNETNYFFELKRGEPVRINFAPEILDGMKITDVILNGEVIKTDFNRFRGILSNPISFMIEDRIEIKFKHTGGIGMMPFIPRPEPGDLSDGYRIINADLNGGNYKIEFEGKSGTTRYFEVRIFDQKLKSVRGADFDIDESKGLVRLKVPFRKSKKEFTTESVVIEVEK
jgi:glycogen debranching enzyme